MHRIAFLFASAAAFGATPFLSRFSSPISEALLVTLGVALALCASWGWQPLTVAGGAMGALASGLTASLSPALAGGLLAGFCLLERTARVRDNRWRAVHVMISIAAGAIGGAAVAHFHGSSILAQTVVIVMSIVLLALPLLIEADDPTAHALMGLADDVDDPARSALREGAQLRRAAHDAPLTTPMARQVRGTWRTLVRLARARARLQNRLASGARADSDAMAIVTGKVNRRIAEHVAALKRAYAAADAWSAAEVSLDDSDAQSVACAGESLEQASRTIVETT